VCGRRVVDPGLEFVPERGHWISRVVPGFDSRKIDGQVAAQSGQ
jgi:hypothetical protein